jgi:hypothetical protein
MPRGDSVNLKLTPLQRVAKIREKMLIGTRNSLMILNTFADSEKTKKRTGTAIYNS